MSGGQACRCAERREPLSALPVSLQGKPVNRPARLWRVLQRRCNHSAFNGYHETYSHYSSVRCLRCGAVWRTMAPFVDFLPDAEIPTDLNIGPGIAGYAEKMKAFGREGL